MDSNEIEERKKIRTCYKLSCFKCHEIKLFNWGDWNWDDWQNIEKSNYLSHDNLTKSQQHYLEDDEQLYENFQQNDDHINIKMIMIEKASQSCHLISQYLNDILLYVRFLFNRQIRVASQIPNLINTDRIEEIVEIIINHNLNNNNLQQITESETNHSIFIY
ncbi:unnamed protein product [Rhizophagus irregularis]|nr:unnamed protein product [Rhizophagus irregularis]